MDVFKVETKNKVDVDKKPRVYFTCHPADFERYFKKVCDDIFKTHDCAIYYTEDMTEVIADDVIQVDLGRNNLFVVPVTFKLLTTPNRAMDEDIPYALKEHIPILPIMMEPGIEEVYSKPDKFGELQYLNPYSTDLTEVSYEEKLKKYLESVLISDELAKRVRAAFDAYIFLSYRKKDRKYANELMRLIHSIPECRDIAIWFDEFLTPGESFKENIEKILDDCKLFTLLVTPQLLEKVVDENGEEQDNYVISTELPLARKKKQEKGTDIFAVEMEDTDKDALLTINIEDYVKPSDETFRARLLESISRMAITTNNTPEHNFLIGLAYLEGIDVEVNREFALDLITNSAKCAIPQAMEKLFRMYKDGVYVTLNYKIAIEWGKMLADYYIKAFGENHPDTLKILSDLAITYHDGGYYSHAIELAEKVYFIRCDVLGEKNIDTLASLSDLALFYSDSQNYKKSLELNEKAYALRCAIFGKDNLNTLVSLANLATVYVYIRNFEKAIKLLDKAYTFCCALLGKEHPNTLIVLSNLAIAYGKKGDHDKELEIQEYIYTYRRNTFGEKHPETLSVLINLSIVNIDINNYENAIALSQKAYFIGCEILGEEHPKTLTALNTLAVATFHIGDYIKALELIEKTYTLRCKVLGEEDLLSINTLYVFAACLSYIGSYKKAINAAEKVYNLRYKLLGKKHPDTIDALEALAILYYSIGNRSKATRLFDAVRKTKKK